MRYLQFIASRHGTMEFNEAVCFPKRLLSKKYDMNCPQRMVINIKVQNRVEFLIVLIS